MAAPSTDEPRDGRTADGSAVGRLSAVLEAARHMAGEHQLEDVLDDVVRAAAAVVGARYAALSSWRSDGTLEKFVHHGIDADTVSRIGRAPEGQGLLGHIVTGDDPIRLVDLTRDPRSCGMPSGHPPMHSLIAAPLRVAGRRYGTLYVTERMDGSPFDEHDEQLVALLAAFAASAIEAVALTDTERELRASRTRAEEKRAFLAEVIAAQEAERARVARDLHDQIGQSLTSVLLGVRLVEVALMEAPPDHERVQSHTRELRELVAQALDEVRRLAFDLRPTVLDDLGVEAALRRLASDMTLRHGLDIVVDVTSLGDVDDVPEDIATVVYRVVQECLTNVVRHADARHAQVDIRFEPGRIRAVIADDGRGFVVSDSPLRSLGLAGMRERASLACGTLEITSSPDHGTVVILEVPA